MTLVRGRAEDWLRTGGPVRCVWMDPPDNIGLGYDGFADKRDDYYHWLYGLVRESTRVAEVVWVSHHSKHMTTVLAGINNLTGGSLLSPGRGWAVRTVVWRFTFGQYSESMGYGYRPITVITRAGVELNYDAVREESERMRIGDTRAAGERVPDDVWDYPRVVGNSRERRSWHPTQHPVAIYDRAMKLSGGPFVDLFAGTGTCFRAGYLNPTVNVVGIEQSAHYCEKITEENRANKDFHHARTHA